MGTVRVVVLDVLSKHGLDVSTPEDEHPVQALGGCYAHVNVGQENSGPIELYYEDHDSRRCAQEKPRSAAKKGDIGAA
jgi:hypothetical protein